MVSVVSGSNLATSLRELDQVTPPTQQQASAQASMRAGQAILTATTDTVTISKEALNKAKGSEKNEKSRAKPEKQTAQKTITRR
ncbi:hypothetical protein [Geobacter sp. SVR]|uniref:hypothetical protein n=1 Tax=Geobacter sp. SVR TaxID=2495594 RepID=UPI00143EFB1A|nr:hypothetical protein [Geobacter sp. SVR]BCS54366.1 hypothetical protein GSVR_26740 [Geobacter sp. SVR]GCF87465.1 hypothetical protein GSbR_40650 [Geobacter sp. SVR]